jgi:hypothetical protein
MPRIKLLFTSPKKAKKAAAIQGTAPRSPSTPNDVSDATTNHISMHNVLEDMPDR